MTSWSMREAIIPIIFSHCKAFVKGPLNAAQCPDLVAMRDTHEELKCTNDRWLCGIMSATFLRDTLRAMPLLRSVSLQIRAREVHGIGWDSLAAVLSTPQLRSFTVGTFLFSPREAPPETWAGDTLAPITTFRYEQRVFRSVLRAYPVQQDTLAFVLTRLHRSLESLLLPIEVAPMAVLAHTQWPQLRELSLNGEFRPSTGDTAPWISLFSGMSKLRVLNLTLALPKGVDRKQLVFWPRGYESRLPWPDLEALTISFPDPEDQIFAHLPPSLRRLSLRCTPHHCLQLWEWREHSYRHSPILHASEMLEILRRLSTPLLDSLQVEYRADDADDDLMCCITERFPHVRVLELHRFQASRDDPVPMTSIAKRLAALRSLHALRAHLELPPSVTARPPPEYRTARVRRYISKDTDALCEIAATLGSVLPQPGLAVWLLQQEVCGARWRRFRQIVKGSIDECPQAELDPRGDRELAVRVFG
ncbi:hypothetical protein GSI_09748 [Ganoderma sinense ZZ0214-1]|uniref:Uncharacterized protein n=1 Tax=Ganoderma sinense ZZ0214-1 TaxID=1077348 RepID=A0A2G8S2Y6_9APHY|nr:hypothetical protein GSI_09748 [Ganoderma sinense ZZ0214-1]